MCETLSTTIFRFTRLYLKMPAFNLSICKDAKEIKPRCREQIMSQYFLLAEVNDVTREEGLVIMGKILTTSVLN